MVPRLLLMRLISAKNSSTGRYPIILSTSFPSAFTKINVGYPGILYCFTKLGPSPFSASIFRLRKLSFAKVITLASGNTSASSRLHQLHHSV